jgi:acyl-CoA-binding protein
MSADNAAADAFWRGEQLSQSALDATLPPNRAPKSAVPAIDLDSGDLDARFKRAADASRTLVKRPDAATMLSLYAMFKQAGAGDAVGDKPGITDRVGRAKFDAWDKLRGTSAERAKADYIALVRSLLHADAS